MTCNKQIGTGMRRTSWLTYSKYSSVLYYDIIHQKEGVYITLGNNVFEAYKLYYTVGNFIWFKLFCVTKYCKFFFQFHSCCHFYTLFIPNVSKHEANVLHNVSSPDRHFVECCILVDIVSSAHCNTLVCVHFHTNMSRNILLFPYVIR